MLSGENTTGIVCTRSGMLAMACRRMSSEAGRRGSENNGGVGVVGELEAGSEFAAGTGSVVIIASVASSSVKISWTPSGRPVFPSGNLSGGTKIT